MQLIKIEKSFKKEVFMKSLFKKIQTWVSNYNSVRKKYKIDDSE